MFLSNTNTYDRSVYHYNMPIFFLQKLFTIIFLSRSIISFFFQSFDPKHTIYLKIQWVSNVNRSDGFKTKTIDSTYRFLCALQYEVKKNDNSIFSRPRVFRALCTRYNLLLVSLYINPLFKSTKYHYVTLTMTNINFGIFIWPSRNRHYNRQAKLDDLSVSITVTLCARSCDVS